MIVVQQFEDLPPKLQANGSCEDHPVLLDDATDLVLDIATDRDNAGSGDKDCTNALALLALDLSAPV